MYELWLLAISYRIIKAIVQFVSRNWVLILFAFLLAALCGIAVGSFFISLFALLKHRQQPNLFNNKIFTSLALILFGFYCLTTEFYKEFPLMYKATAIGNVLGLLLTTMYVIRFIQSNRYNSHSLLQPLLIDSMLSAAMLFIYNQFVPVSSYITQPDEAFPTLMQNEKRAKYQDDFKAFQQSHQKLAESDYHCYDVLKKHHQKIVYTGGSKDEDTLLIIRFTAMLQVTYYTYTPQHGYEEITGSTFLDGFDADYNDGNIVYKDSFPNNIDDDKIDYAKQSGKPVYKEIALRLIVIPKKIDNYIAWREGKPLDGAKELYVAKEYLESKGIPVDADTL